MSVRFFRGVAGLLLVLPCWGCSSGAPVTSLRLVEVDGGEVPGPPTFPQTAFLAVTGQSGLASVEVRTSPQPPSRGTIAVQLIIRSITDGATVDGLNVHVVPWMPAHDHGSSIVPSVTQEGTGTYVVSDVDLFMPGHWELQTTLSGPVADYVAPAFDVP